MFTLRNALSIVAGSVLLGSLAGSPVLAAPKPAAAAGGLTIGTVDVEKAFDNCPSKTKLDEELQSYKTAVMKRIDLRKNNLLLSADEFKTLSDLSQKDSPSVADAAKIKELTDLNLSREKEYTDLQQKKDPSTAEAQRLNSLQLQLNSASAALDNEAKSATSDLQSKTVTMSREIMDKVQAAIVAVAKDKGISLVLNKMLAGNIMVVYSDTDLTDDVIKKLK